MGALRGSGRCGSESAGGVKSVILLPPYLLAACTIPMPRLAVYQLSCALDRDNSEIIRELQHMGVPVTSHSNSVEERLADRLRKERGVYSPEAGKVAAAGGDDFVAVDVPDEVVEAPVETVAA